MYLNLFLLCSANLVDVKWYLKVDLICTSCISGEEESVSLCFFAIYKFPRVTVKLLHLSLGLGQDFLLLSLLSRQLKLNRHWKPVMEQGPWLGSTYRDGAFGQTTLCPEGLKSKTSRWEEDKEEGRCSRSASPGNRLWDRDLRARESWGSFLNIKTWRRWGKLELVWGGASQVQCQQWPWGARELGGRFRTFFLHLDRSSDVGYPREEIVSLGEAPLFSRIQILDRHSTMNYQPRIQPATAGLRTGDLKRGCGWHTTSSTAKEADVGWDTIVSWTYVIVLIIYWCATIPKLSGLKQTNKTFQFCSWFWKQTGLGSTGQFFCKVTGFLMWRFRTTAQFKCLQQGFWTSGC